MSITLALGVPQTLTAGFSARPVALDLILTLTSQDAPTNTSSGTYTLQVRETTDSVSQRGYNDCVASVVIESLVFSASNLNYNFNLTMETVVVASGTWTVTHAGDGSKSFTSSASYDGKVPIGTASVSDTIILPTIPRATVPSVSTTTPATGDVITVTLAPASTGFSHRLTWMFQPGTGGTALTNKTVGFAGGGGSALGTVEGASDNGTPGNFWVVPTGTTTPTLTIPHAVFAQSVDYATRTVTLAVDTYSGATFIGFKAITFPVTLAASEKPTIAGITHSEATASPAVASLVGAYVQSVTKLALALTTPAGIHGSTLVSRSISVAGQTLAANGITPLAIAASGTVPITATVTDSRGRVSSVRTQNVNVLAWTPPAFASTALVARALSSGVTSEDAGTYFKVAPADFSVPSLLVSAVQKNRVEFRLSYRVYGGSTWTTDGAGWINLPDTPSAIRFTGTRLSTFGSASVGTAYEVQIEIRDVLATSTVVRVVPKAKVLMHWNGSTGVALGARHSGAASPLEIWGRGKQASNGATLRDIADQGDLDSLGTDANTGSTVVKRDSNGKFSAGTPTSSTHVATKGYVDGFFTDTGWLACTFASGYNVYPGGGGLHDVEARKIGNAIHLRGLITNTANNLLAVTNYTNAFILPASIVSSREQWVPAGSSNGGGSMLMVHTNRYIDLRIGNSGLPFIPLDGVSFLSD